MPTLTPAAWHTIPVANPAAEVTISQALTHLAAMIGTVLAPFGLEPDYSFALPPEQVGLDGYSGPVAIHLAGAQAPVQLTVYDSCMVEALYTVRSYYFLARVQQDRADAWQTTQDWLLPILRAQFANQSLGGTVERCVPVSAEWVGAMAYGTDAPEYTGLIVTSHLYINYEMDME